MAESEEFEGLVLNRITVVEADDHSAEVTELVKALVAAQAEYPVIAKSKLNPHFGSLYADLADILPAIAPILSRHGLVVLQPPSDAGEGGYRLTTWLFHTSGQWMRSVMRLPIATGSNAQAIGSALTYLRRYVYCAILGIVADADDDGNAASAIANAASPPARSPRREREKLDPNAPLPDDLSALDNRQLYEALKSRGLSIAGSKAEKLGRLREHQEAQTTDAAMPQVPAEAEAVGAGPFAEYDDEPF